MPATLFHFVLNPLKEHQHEHIESFRYRHCFLLGLIIFAALTGGAEPQEELEAAAPSSLEPQRELAEMFGYMNDHTDTQRENAKSRFAGTFIYMEARDDKERHFIEAMKTGDIIHFKGKIDDVFMRSFVIKPAILIIEDNPETVTGSEDKDALAIPENPAATPLPKQA